MEQYIFHKETCGTVLTVDIMSLNNPAAIVQDCFSLCEKFEQRYSRFIPWNWLDTINKQQNESIVLDEESYGLITLMLELAEKTGWLFDPTIIATLESYGYDKDYSFQKKQWWPVGYQHIELLDHAMILRNGVKIEFGTIWKWYLLDVMAKKLQESGINHFLLDFGGDIFGQWWYEVGLENPFDLDQVIGTIKVDNIGIASSNGKKRTVGDFHHLLDARTWKPVMDIAGVYIAAQTWLLADTYSTAVFVSWAERAQKLLETTDEITGLIVFSDWSYWKKHDYPGELFM